MSGLAKRVDALEQTTGGKATRFLWVDYASDGGLVYAGRFYADTGALLSELGIDQDQAHVFGWQPGQTAAELLAEAAERAKNPPLEITLDELGEYGRKLVEEGITPAVAKHLESLQVNREEV